MSRGTLGTGCLVACALVSGACFEDSEGDGSDATGTGGSGTASTADDGNADGSGGDDGSSGSGGGSGGSGSATDDGGSDGGSTGGTSDGGTSGGDTSGDGGTTDDGSTDGGSTDGGGTTGGDTSSDTGCGVGRTCVDAPPSGWSGPFVRKGHMDPAQLPTCAAPYPNEAENLFSMPVADPAECSACSCGSPTGVECSLPEVRFYGSSGCDQVNFGSAFETLPPGMCKVYAQATGAYGAESDTVTAIGGTGECAPSGGVPTLPPFDWQTQVRACGTPASLDPCETDRVCAPTGSPGFDPGLCIVRPGDTSCPPGDYNVRRVLHTSADDLRGCSPCSCGTPGGAQCDAMIQFHFNGTCTDEYVSIDTPGSECVTLWGEPPSSGEMIIEGIIGGSCAAGGGQPVGQVDPKGPVTMCCTA